MSTVKFIKDSKEYYYNLSEAPYKIHFYKGASDIDVLAFKETTELDFDTYPILYTTTNGIEFYKNELTQKTLNIVSNKLSTISLSYPKDRWNILIEDNILYINPVTENNTGSNIIDELILTLDSVLAKVYLMQNTKTYYEFNEETPKLM